MRQRFLFFSLFFLILLAFTINCVYAEEPEPDVNLLDLPTQLASHIGISVFAAGILLSTLALVSIALTLSLLKAKALLILIADFSTMAFLLAIGWLPFWILLILTLAVATLLATIFKDSVFK